MAQQSTHRDHLVVIAHGIMGKRTDLNYLAGKLEAVGFHVLRSGSNELGKSLVGVEAAAKRLQVEIEEEISQKSEIRKISFVGNSIGGIFVRYVVKLLYDPETKTVAGLEPVHFMVGLMTVVVRQIKTLTTISTILISDHCHATLGCQPPYCN